MKKRNPWWMVFIAFCVLGLVQLACEYEPDPPEPGARVTLPAAARGGGWIVSDGGKATFGFQLTCDKETGDIQGQFQYNDHAAGVAFHGVVQDHADDCRVEVPAVGDPLPYGGVYTPQPKKLGDPGDLEIALDVDGCLWVTLTGGIHDGYSHGGCQEGGSLRVWGLEK